MFVWASNGAQHLMSYRTSAITLGCQAMAT